MIRCKMILKQRDTEGETAYEMSENDSRAGGRSSKECCGWLARGLCVNENKNRRRLYWLYCAL